MLLEEVGKLPKTSATSTTPPTTSPASVGLSCYQRCGARGLPCLSRSRCLRSSMLGGSAALCPRRPLIGLALRTRLAKVMSSGNWKHRGLPSFQGGGQRTGSTRDRSRADRQYGTLSYVDAENQFGATVRTRFYCSATWTSNDSSSQPRWLENEVFLAPWAASTPDAWIKQAQLAFRSGDFKSLREIAQLWLQAEPASPYAAVSAGGGAYGYDDYETAARSLGSALESGRVELIPWQRTAWALYAAALWRTKGPSAEPVRAVEAFLATPGSSLLSREEDQSYEAWAKGVQAERSLPAQAPLQSQGSLSLAARSRHWRCDNTQKWTCEVPGGCTRETDPTVIWILLDFRENTYQRCSRSGCDKYAATVTERSFFTFLQLPGHPDVFLKIGLADGFVDVAARGTSIYNSFGYCKPIS